MFIYTHTHTHTHTHTNTHTQMYYSDEGILISIVKWQSSLKFLS